MKIMLLGSVDEDLRHPHEGCTTAPTPPWLVGVKGHISFAHITNSIFEKKVEWTTVDIRDVLRKTVKWRKILSRTLSDLYLQCFRILLPTFERTLLENPRLALDQNIWIGIFQPKSAENTSVIVVWWNVNLHTSRSYGSCWHFRDSESPSHIFHRTWLLTIF